jgi:transposase InsO family protein
VWVYLLKEKGAAARVMGEWVKMVEGESGHKVKTLRSDRGGEFMGKEFQMILQDLHIMHDPTPAYTPQLNGVVERWHRTLMEGVRTLLQEARVSTDWWGEAVRQVAWVKNRTTHRALPANTTPW